MGGWAVTGWLRSWFRCPEPMLIDQLARFRAETADLPKPRTIYALPERDERKPHCVHCYSDNDALVEAKATKVARFPRRGK